MHGLLDLNSLFSCPACQISMLCHGSASHPDAQGASGKSGVRQKGFKFQPMTIHVIYLKRWSSTTYFPKREYVQRGRDGVYDHIHAFTGAPLETKHLQSFPKYNHMVFVRKLTRFLLCQNYVDWTCTCVACAIPQSVVTLKPLEHEVNNINDPCSLSKPNTMSILASELDHWTMEEGGLVW